MLFPCHNGTILHAPSSCRLEALALENNEQKLIVQQKDQLLLRYKAALDAMKSSEGVSFASLHRDLAVRFTAVLCSCIAATNLDAVVSWEVGSLYSLWSCRCIVDRVMYSVQSSADGMPSLPVVDFNSQYTILVAQHKTLSSQATAQSLQAVLSQQQHKVYSSLVTLIDCESVCMCSCVYVPCRRLCVPFFFFLRLYQRM